MQDTLPIAWIVHGKNPREYFNPQEMAELEDGIRAYGVLQPIPVRPVSSSDLYEIVAGERRWRAARHPVLRLPSRNPESHLRPEGSPLGDTTNAIESVNMGLRKVTKSRAHFPTTMR